VVFGHLATCTNDGASCGACPSDINTGLPPPFGAPGTAELHGNDFIVSMGLTYSEWEIPRTLENEGGAVMHEVGHNLDLHHGGGDGYPEGKPNYFSVLPTRSRTHAHALHDGGFEQSDVHDVRGPDGRRSRRARRRVPLLDAALRGELNRTTARVYSTVTSGMTSPG